MGEKVGKFLRERPIACALGIVLFIGGVFYWSLEFSSLEGYPIPIIASVLGFLIGSELERCRDVWAFKPPWSRHPTKDPNWREVYQNKYGRIALGRKSGRWSIHFRWLFWRTPKARTYDLAIRRANRLIKRHRLFRYMLRRLGRAVIVVFVIGIVVTITYAFFVVP